MTYTCFNISKKSGVAKLTMSRPEKANSMNNAFWDELPKLLNELDAGGDIRVCILSGEGKHFSGGMDLSFFANPEFINLADPRKREIVAQVVKDLQNALATLQSVRFPVIAAIHGACLGGALEMAGFCDFRVACADAQFGIEEINVGMMADLGALQLLPRLMPEGIVRELAYTGDRLDAERAHRLHLVNAVYQDYDTMMRAVEKIAKKIATKPPLAISGCKRAFNFGRNHGLTEALSHACLLQSAILDPKSVMAAMQANMNKSDAKYDNSLAK